MSCSYQVGKVIGLKGPGQELLGEHGKVVTDGKHDPSLLVVVGDRGCLRAACDYTKCRVLNLRQFNDIGLGSIGEPDWSGIVEN